MLAWLQAPGSLDQITGVGGQIVDYVKLLAILAGVLILAYLTIRKGIPALTGLRPAEGGPIQVMARFPLEPRKTLYIIRAGTDYYLIGTSDTDMFYLTALDGPSLESQLRAAPPPVAAVDFRTLLDRFRKPGGRP